MVLRRFVSIRAYPSKLYSDNGTQLVAANKELQKVVKDLDSKSLQQFGVTQGLKWIFSSADAPWQNGISRALIKSGKRAITLAIGESVMTFSELRPCSLYFHLNVSNFDVQSLLQDVKRCGINMSAVRCAQRVSKDAYTITFKTPEERDLFSKKSKYIARQPDAVISVWIYDAPCELPGDAIKHRLSFYGVVQKIYRCTYLSYHVETGV